MSAADTSADMAALRADALAIQKLLGTLVKLAEVDAVDPGELLDRVKGAETDFSLIQRIRAQYSDPARLSEAYGCISAFARTRRDMQRIKASHRQLLLGGLKTMKTRHDAIDGLLKGVSNGEA